MNYIIILFFIVTSDTKELKKFWEVEFLNNKSFSWIRLLKRIAKGNRVNFIFWWRLANCMHSSTNKHYRRTASKIQNKLIYKYNTEIELGATIGIGLKIHHYSSIIITRHAIIGDNFTCYQNITIGWRKNPYSIVIGNNVVIGCGSTILGGDIIIGNNAKIGAMSLVLTNVPENCTYITDVKTKIIFHT
ncbi:TPA: serine acetyltransferase [Providencia rettgeri]|nr:serine acetyltransferase [Providencia rettgeri]